MKIIHAKMMPLQQLIQWVEVKFSVRKAQVGCAGIDLAIGPGRVVPKNKTLALPAVDTQVNCHEGQLWITRLGDHEDYIINSGQSFAVRGNDQAVVHTLRRSCVSVEEMTQ